MPPPPLYSGSGGNNQTAVYPFNTWLHVVLQVDADGSTIYVNGEEAASGGATSAFTDSVTYIGREAASTPYARGGYLSDCYFADGKVLPPEISSGFEFCGGYTSVATKNALVKIGNYRTLHC